MSLWRTSKNLIIGVERENSTCLLAILFKSLLPLNANSFREVGNNFKLFWGVFFGDISDNLLSPFKKGNENNERNSK